ncbi:hypothetical protein [Methylobacterium sp. WSM2598]|uniref:hypothetical protein n=1 Tax=Methylobacterium sp. WSM2598 TaxID=398261 RepID=UPI001F300B8D|nr:hypothetical protein [Methylobacterium sp. WSM2598]
MALTRVAKDDSVKSFKKDWTEVGQAVEKVGGVPCAGGWWTAKQQQHAVDVLAKGGASALGAKALVARCSAVEARGGPTSANSRSGAFGLAQFKSRSGGYSRLRDGEVVNDPPPGRPTARRIGDDMGPALQRRGGLGRRQWPPAHHHGRVPTGTRARAAMDDLFKDVSITQRRQVDSSIKAAPVWTLHTRIGSSGWSAARFRRGLPENGPSSGALRGPSLVVNLALPCIRLFGSSLDGRPRTRRALDDRLPRFAHRAQGTRSRGRSRSRRPSACARRCGSGAARGSAP